MAFDSTALMKSLDEWKRRQPPRKEYVLTLEALPDGPPAEVRLRRLLKCCLRSFGMKCLRVEETSESIPLGGVEASGRVGRDLGAI